MNKYYLLVLLIFLSHYFTPHVYAITLFKDSFNNPGYDNTIWEIPSWGFAPLPSSFGIIYDTDHNGLYSALFNTNSFTDTYTIKIDEKINSSPASDINFSFSSADGRWKIVQFYGLGVGGPPNSVKTYDSNNFGSGLATWNTTPGIHHLEVTMSPNANSPIIVKEDGATLLTWQSSVGFTANGFYISLYGTGSEFANFQLCDSLGCDPIEPTPTITTTPTPLPVNKIVVVPGFGASWNPEALLSCGTSTEGTWSANPIASSVYTPLIDTLQQDGYDTNPYYYDWTKNVTDSSLGLKSYISTLIGPNERIHLVGHSLGGLVGRSYIEHEQNENKISKFITAGSPHHGTPLAYYAWAGGDVPNDDLLWRFGLTFLQKHCGKLYDSKRQMIQTLVPSIQNLLPTFDYLVDKKTQILKPLITMGNKNNWLPTEFTYPFYGVTVGTLSGTSFDTVKQIETREAHPKDTSNGDWLDGQPIKSLMTSDGDGTILTESSQLDTAENMIVSENHTGLIHNLLGIGMIQNFLGVPQTYINTQTIQSNPTPQTGLFIIAYPAHTIMTQPNGKTVQDSNSLMGLISPESGSYTLQIQPKSSSTILIVGQFTNHKTEWKEYILTGKAKITKTVLFDQNNPLEDPIQ